MERAFTVLSEKAKAARRRLRTAKRIDAGYVTTKNLGTVNA
jgi:hypothetical protein